MTTVQTMLCARNRSARRAALVAAMALATLCGCARNGDRLRAPEAIVAPYDQARGEVLWAVAPLANESGVSFADTDGLADALVAAIDQVRGVACLPLNRTIAAMRAANLRAIRSPRDARALAGILGVDALVLGSITAYDPYDPPKLGLTLGLYPRDARPEAGFDPMRLQRAYTDAAPAAPNDTLYLDRPAAVVSAHLDGAGHDVQMDLRRYAEGRHGADSALGWRGHLASMDLYERFAAHWAVSRLIEQERLRLGRPSAARDAQDATRTP